VKFTHHHGESNNIGTEERETDIEISVSDNGIGIEPAEQKKLFTLIGYNITTVGTDEREGYGTGTDTVQGVCGKERGKIVV
jgi:signal transduction histidine kinase